MQNDVVISVTDLKKKFRVYYDKSNNLKDKMLFWKRNRYEDRCVLQGITFDIRRGEAVGLVGKNGCGKSTTLKLLTRIMYPTSGKVTIKGKVSSLIELGAGFHPDMSGRENIYTNASIFGLTKKQIDDRLQEIIEFSELEEFIDNPVRTYSSGMYMRLAFSVAINVQADILLIDEILAVGDVSFQKKCFEKLKQVKESGTTIVIVSHALGQIEEICDRSIWIADGMIKMDGEPKEVHKYYLEWMEEERKKIKENSTASGVIESAYFMGHEVLRLGSRQMLFERLRLLGINGEEKNEFATGDDVMLELQFSNHSPYSKAGFAVRIYNEDNILCYGTGTNYIYDQDYVDIKDRNVITFKFEKMNLTPGRYYMDIDLDDSEKGVQDRIHHAAEFMLAGEKKSDGIVDFNTQLIL